MGESVSFGKYENDGLLCWEKWSTFSPNNNNNNNNNSKYLEEVGKCSTPGSVAQKKAFFEAHYKKIAAMKLAMNQDDQIIDGLEPLNAQVLELNTDSNNLEEVNAEQVEEEEQVNAEQVDLELDSPQKKKNSIGMKKKPVASSKIPLLSKPKETSTSTSSFSVSMSTSITSRPRSLFMEQMGDKDIVKRAFKTFQNRVNQLPSSSSSPPKQLPTKQKTSTSMAYQKENERSRKAAPWKSGRSLGGDEKALKSNQRRKEAEKSNTREGRQLSLKSKEVKDAEMKRVRQKAKPMPKAAQGALKST